MGVVWGACWGGMVLEACPCSQLPPPYIAFWTTLLMAGGDIKGVRGVIIGHNFGYTWNFDEIFCSGAKKNAMNGHTKFQKFSMHGLFFMIFQSREIGKIIKNKPGGIFSFRHLRVVLKIIY